MAKKKKQEDAPQGSPAWMATFSDLMNLLLCFFVLLFSMSSVDESKAEALIKSLASTFSIFSGGGSSFQEGTLISNGANQLSQLDDYFMTMGQTSEGTNEQNPNDSVNGGDSDNNQDPGVNITPTPAADSSEWADYVENKAQTGLLYDEVLGLADKYNIASDIDVGVDAETYRYIQIEISGTVLFDPGAAELKEAAKPIISKLGDILRQYSGYKIEIIGHTDNVPQTNTKKFKNNRHLSAARALAVADYLIDEKKLDERNIEFTGRGEQEPIASNETEEGRNKNRRVEIRLYNLKNSED